MQDDFEHKLSQRMQEFSVSPQPEIWQRVEAALPEKKRRRIAFWWWLLPLAIITGLSLWWVNNNRSINEPKQIAQQKKNENKITSSTSEETKDTSIKDSTPLLAETATIHSKQNSHKNDKERIANSTIDSSAKNQKSIVAVEKKTNTITYSSSIKAARKNDKKESSVATLSKLNINSGFKEKQLLGENDKIKAKAVLQNGNAINKTNISDEPALQPDTDAYKSIASNTDSAVLVSTTVPGANDTATKIAIATKPQDTTQRSEAVDKGKFATTQGNKKSVWLADAAVGTSWLIGTSSLDRRAVRMDNFYSSPSIGGNAGTGGSSIVRNFLHPGVSFNISLGVMHRYELNKHVKWQTALHYKLLSATQQVGSAIDTSSIYSRASAPSLIYNTGNRSTYRNIVHQLQFSPGLVLTLNPTAHLPFSITTGGAVAYNVSNNLLLHDYRSGTYIRSARSSSKMQYSAYLGMDISIQKKIQLGFIYQHSFSNVAKADLGSNYQWRQLQFHISLPVSK